MVISGNSGTGGSLAGPFRLLTSTNLVLHMNSWTPVVTNVFDGAGRFTITNVVATNKPVQFYRIQVQ